LYLSLSYRDNLPETLPIPPATHGPAKAIEGSRNMSETLKRSESRIHLLRNTKKTAVLGIARSGRTTFLTAMIDRVLRHDGREETVLRYVRAKRHIERISPLPGDARAFPIEKARDALAAGVWPAKTVVDSQFAYRTYVTTDNAASRLLEQYAEERTMMDIVGERVADFSMAGKSYEEWADALNAEIGERQEYITYCTDYLQLMQQAASGGLDETTVLYIYKKVLARYTRNSLPLVTPSAFLVHPKLKYPTPFDQPAEEMAAEALIQRGICGLDEANQFAPLMAEARAANPELTQRFKARYNMYRDEIAQPLALGFTACENLLILVDVGDILVQGPAAYRSTRFALRRALEYIDPGSTKGKALGDFAINILTGGRYPAQRVNSIGVVATKTDCVHRLDRANLETLLRQMTADLFEKALRERWLKVKYFHCAAIQATTDEAYPRLSCDILPDPNDPDSRQHGEAEVSCIPRSWPAENVWQEVNYKVATPVPPKLNLLGDKPFPSLGMDEVMQFIGLAHFNPKTED
jgi:predicted YcjX-like family ATPase